MSLQDRDGPAANCDKEAAVAWVILITAGVFETVWAYYMKLSDGFSRPGPTVATFAAMAVSIGMLGIAMKSLPLGTAYSVWTGIGAVGAFVVGIVVLGEAASPMRVLAAALIVGGMVLMKVSSPT
jgi:quaternary ammonium compound-resistance protein SugE